MRDYIKCRVRSLNAPLEGLIGDQVFFTIKQFNNVPYQGQKIGRLKKPPFWLNFD